jgi:hypothetical protein
LKSGKNRESDVPQGYLPTPSIFWQLVAVPI